MAALRQAMAGGDAKELERLSRMQDPAAIWKSFRELEGKLSKRAEPPRLVDNATPEQLGEWRKGLGLPEIAKDAKPEAFLDAYKIKAPEGHALTEVEKGMVSDYAKLAYEQGHSPREVKAAVDFFFQQNAASQQALNKLGVDFQKSEQNGWRDAVGSKEYEAQVAAAQSWLKDQFKDKPEVVDQLLQARLPNGGRLGDMRWFGEMLAKQAMGEGYTDRIVGNALESNGKSLAEQQREIDGLRFKDKGAYDEAMKPGGRYEQILAGRLARGEIDEMGRERRRA